MTRGRNNKGTISSRRRQIEEEKATSETSEEETGASAAAIMTGAANQQLSDLIRTIMREEIGVVLSKLQPQLDDLKENISECSRKVGNIEETLSDLERRVTKLETVNEQLRKTNSKLREKAERLESDSRKCNLRVFGLTKDVEKGNPTSYMNSLFKEMFKGKIQTEPAVEVAHRVGPQLKDGTRAMIVRMQRYRAREEILTVAKKERTMKYGERNLRIFPDLTADMAKQRATFREVRENLRNAGVRHGIIHPATLIITVGTGHSKKFTDYREAEVFWDSVIKPGLWTSSPD